MKRVTFSFLLACVASLALGDGAQVSSGWAFSEVTVIQHWPLNRSVDIKFFARQVDGQGSSRRAAKLKVSIGDRELPEAEFDNLWIRGEGRKCLVWTPAETGYPAELNDVAVTLSVVEEVREVGYLVVDLESGKRSYKPLSFADEVNCDTYKTTHMAFRYIPSTYSAAWRHAKGKDTFRIGSDGTRTDLGITQDDKNREGTANITLTKSFFFGVFPMTRKQYALLGGSTSSADTVPIRSVNYGMLRGNDGTNNAAAYCVPKTYDVDPETPVGRLRALTKLRFDFPTEAQWEYAARAGHDDSEYFFAEDPQKTLETQLNEYGANNANNSVGSKKPNDWGIYDLIGCCHQWTLTAVGETNGAVSYTKHADAVGPVGVTPTTGDYAWRIVKGSHYKTNDAKKRVQRCAYRMALKSNGKDSGEQANAGCRLRLTLED